MFPVANVSVREPRQKYIVTMKNLSSKYITRRILIKMSSER